ncbi:MAG: hypothetical protein ACI9UJ_001624, partial [bacterium]
AIMVIVTKLNWPSAFNETFNPNKERKI